METKRNPNLHAVQTTDGPRSGEQTAGNRNPSRIARFSNELRQRKVCRCAITYSLILWLNLQIGDLLFPVLGLPEWTLKFVMFIGLMGFPVVVLLAWAFQITARGIELDIKVRDDESAVEKLLDRVVSILLLALSLILTILVSAQILH